MNRTSFITLATLGGVIAPLAFRQPAFADGSVSITNKTIDEPTTIEVRIGNTQQDAVPAGGQTLKKGETFRLESTNLMTFWRREANPGSGDGKWTDWNRIDSRNGDQHVEF